MRSGQKFALSLLISVVLFALFSIAAFSGLFSVIEARFYQPKIMSEKKQRLESVLSAETEYFDALSKRFLDFSSSDAVRSALSSSSTSFIETREQLREQLFSGTSCLRGIRIIDKNGVNIHYSTYDSDILSKKAESKILKKYTEIDEVSFSYVNTDSKSGRIFFDEKNMRITFSVPIFYDGVGAVCVFYTEPGDFNSFLYSKNLIDITGYGILLADSTGLGGFVFGLPNVARGDLRKKILDHWKNRGHISEQHLVAVSQDDMEKIEPKIFFSLKNPDERLGFVAWIYDEDVFVFSDSVKILLLVLVFLTWFLLVYLVFSLKHDDMVVIKDRIKRFQVAFITEYVDRAQSGNLPEDFSDRKELLAKEIKKSLGKRGLKYSKEVDELLDHSWLEILSALGVRKNVGISGTTSINPEELKKILEEILGSGNLRISSSPALAPADFDTPSVSQADSAELDSTEPNSEIISDDVVEEEEESVEEIGEEDTVLEVPESDEASVDDSESRSDEKKIKKPRLSAKSILNNAGSKLINKLKKLEGFDENDDDEISSDGFFDEETLRTLEGKEDDVLKVDASSEEFGESEFFSDDDLKDVSAKKDSELTSEFFAEDDLDFLEDSSETAPKKLMETRSAPVAESEPEALDEVEEIEEVEEAESEPEALDEVEEIEEAEEAESEPEALDEVEEIEEVEEAESEPEGLDEVEEIEEVEEAESELEALDEVEEIEEAEEAEEAESEPEVLDEVEEIEEVEEAESEPEALDEVEEIEEVEEAESEPEALDEVEEIEEVEEAESEPEALDEVEEIEEAEEEESEPEEKSDSEEVPLSEFSSERGSYDPGKDVDLSEPLKFTSSDRKKLVPDPKFAFQAKKPDYSSLDAYFYAHSKDEDEFDVSFVPKKDVPKVKSAEKKVLNEIKNVPNAEKLNSDKNIKAVFDSEKQKNEKSEEMMPFLFTKFTADTPNNDYNVDEDSQEAIIQNADGTFRISRLPRYTKTDINIEFKQLVDSVLR